MDPITHDGDCIAIISSNHLGSNDISLISEAAEFRGLYS